MASSSQRALILIEQIQEWQQKLASFGKSMNDLKIKEILKKIPAPKKITQDNVKEYLNNVSSMLNSLSSIEYDNDSIEVIDHISSAVVFSSDYELASCTFAKIGLKVMKQNPDVIKYDSRVLKIFVENMTQSISRKIAKLDNETTKQSILIFLKMITELIKMYSKELGGNENIIRLIKNHNDVFTKFTEIKKIADEIASFGLNNDDDEKEEDKSPIQKALSNPTSINVVMMPNIQSNLCCQTLTAMSKDHAMINKNPEICDLMLCEVFNLITSPHLSSDNFKFIEKFLMDAILEKDDGGKHLNFLSTLCMTIFIDIIRNLTNKDLIIEYFELFQNFFLHSSASINKERISLILKFIFKTHQETCADKVRSEKVANVLNTTPPVIRTQFSENLQMIKTDPTLQNYSKMCESVQNLIIDELDQQSMKDFCNLIELMEFCDWSVFSSLIIQILQVIKNAKKMDKKMLIMLKIHASFDKKMPLDVMIKTLEVFDSCLPHVSNLNGLVQLIDGTLEKFLNENYVLRRAWYNMTKNRSEKEVEKYKIDENITFPENIEEIFLKSTSSATNTKEASKKRQISTINDGNQHENLKKLLKYAQWLLSSQNINQKEHDTIFEIRRVFDKIISAEKENVKRIKL